MLDAQALEKGSGSGLSKEGRSRSLLIRMQRAMLRSTKWSRRSYLQLKWQGVQISRKSAIDSLSYGQGKFSYFAVIVTEVSSL